MKKLTELGQLSLDVYRGVVKNFSPSEGNDAIKNVILEACGGDFNFYNFQDNKFKVYAVIAEVLTPAIGASIEDIFKDQVEYKFNEFGDITEFVVEDKDLFKVYSTANGNGDVRRQKLYNSKISLVMENLEVKIYAELDQYMAGRINWTTMVDRITKSYVNDLSTRVYTAVYGAYSNLVSPYALTGSYSEDSLKDMIAHVEAATGQTAVVLGTKKALGKISTAIVSEKSKEDMNKFGYYGIFNGTELQTLPQAHTNGTNNFAINDSVLFVVPNSEKFIKVGLEGNAIIFDNMNMGNRNDLQIETLYIQKAGVAVLVADTWGMYKLS